MTKRFSCSILILVLLCFCNNAQADIVKRVKVRGAMALHAPILNDSVNNLGVAFNLSELLKAPVSLQFPQESTTIVETDSTGIINLKKTCKENEIQLVGFQVRPEGFMSGQFKVTSPLRWEMFINGVSTKLKAQAEDSITTSSTISVPYLFEPEIDYEVVIKTLLPVDEYLNQPSLRIESIKDSTYQNIPLKMDASMKKRFTIYNAIYGHKVSSITLSNSGNYLLVGYTQKLENNKTIRYTELRDTKTNQIILPRVATEAKWMPKSDKIYYTRKGQLGEELITFNPQTFQEEVISNNLPEDYFVWSPQEDYLLFQMFEKGITEKGPLIRINSADDRIPGNRDRYYLAKYDIQNKVLERLTFGFTNTSLNDISKDGRYLLYSCTKENITEIPFYKGSLYRLDLETRAIDTLAWQQRYEARGIFSPDGKQVVLMGSGSCFNGIGKNTGNLPIANDFDYQLFLMDIDSKEVKPITTHFNPSVKSLVWNEKDNCIYMNTEDKDCVHMYKYNPKANSFELIPSKVDVVQGYDVAQSNPSVIAYFGQDNHQAGIAFVYNQKKRTTSLVANPMEPILKDIQLGETKDWSFIASDGTEIDGLICLPPNFDVNKKYPLIVYYYGGTSPTTPGLSSPYSAQIFAAKDYVVYVLQPSGTTGYGQEFSARHVNAWGKRTADDIIEGVKLFCKEHKFVDEKKIGCLGASYGGFMTMYLQTQTDLFTAAISHAGISNVTSYWGEGYWGYSYNSIAAANSYPWNNPALFTKQSALFNADKINTPLLLLHGTADTNVPIGESIQLYNALKILGKTVEFIEVEGENHFILTPEKRILWHKSMIAWFDRWLKDRPEWWNNMYPKRHL